MRARSQPTEPCELRHASITLGLDAGAMLGDLQRAAAILTHAPRRTTTGSVRPSIPIRPTWSSASSHDAAGAGRSSGVRHPAPILAAFPEARAVTRVPRSECKTKKRAVGFKVSEGMAVPAELASRSKFARQKSKLAGTIRGSYFDFKNDY